MGDVIVSDGFPEIPIENGRCGGVIVFAEGVAPQATANINMVVTVCNFMGTFESLFAISDT